MWSCWFFFLPNKKVPVNRMNESPQDRGAGFHGSSRASQRHSRRDPPRGLVQKHLGEKFELGTLHSWKSSRRVLSKTGRSPGSLPADVQHLLVPPCKHSTLDSRAQQHGTFWETFRPARPRGRPDARGGRSVLVDEGLKTKHAVRRNITQGGHGGRWRGVGSVEWTTAQDQDVHVRASLQSVISKKLVRVHGWKLS